MEEIRPLKPEDKGRLAELLGQIRQQTKRAAGLNFAASFPATENLLRWLDATCSSGAFGVFDGPHLVGVGYAHVLGQEGWIGPLGVFQIEQGKGFEEKVLQVTIQHLLANGVAVLGLEAPAAPDWLGTLGRIGFSPSSTVLALEVPVASLPDTMDFWVDAYSSKEGEAREKIDRALHQFADTAAPGRNYLPLIHATRDLALGDTLIFLEGDEIVGFAVVHTQPYYAGEGEELARVVALACHTKRHVGRFDQLLTAIGAYARVNNLKRVRVRCASDDPTTYQYLLSKGFRVNECRLRLALEGYPEVKSPGYVVLSDWEL